MKKYSLPLVLLCSYPTFAGCFTSAATVPGVEAAAVLHKMQARKKTDFRQLEIIRNFDGKYGMLDGYSILESLKALSFVTAVQLGEANQAGVRVGLFALDGKQVTLKDLVLEEHKLNKEGVAQDNPRRVAFNETLKAAKDYFNDNIKKLRGPQQDSDIARKIKHDLITYFLADQARQSSLMANADHPEEKARMYAASAKDFYAFLNDLKHFFEDLIESCPEAHKQYKELAKKPR